MSAISHIDKLPQPILIEILSFVQAVGPVALVCKLWKECVEEVRKRFLDKMYQIEPFRKLVIQENLSTLAKIQNVFNHAYVNRFYFDPLRDDILDQAERLLPYNHPEFPGFGFHCATEVLNESINNRWAMVKRQIGKPNIPLDIAYFEKLIHERKEFALDRCATKLGKIIEYDFNVFFPNNTEEEVEALLEKNTCEETISFAVDKIIESDYTDETLLECLEELMHFWNTEALSRILESLNSKSEEVKIRGLKQCFNYAVKSSSFEAITTLHSLFKQNGIEVPVDDKTNYSATARNFLSKEGLVSPERPEESESFFNRLNSQDPYFSVQRLLDTAASTHDKTQKAQLMSDGIKLAHTVVKSLIKKIKKLNQIQGWHYSDDDTSRAKIEAKLHLLVLLCDHGCDQSTSEEKRTPLQILQEAEHLTAYASPFASLFELTVKHHFLTVGYDIHSLGKFNSFDFLFSKKPIFIKDIIYLLKIGVEADVILEATGKNPTLAGYFDLCKKNPQWGDILHGLPCAVVQKGNYQLFKEMLGYLPKSVFLEFVRTLAHETVANRQGTKRKVEEDVSTEPSKKSKSESN